MKISIEAEYPYQIKELLNKLTKEDIPLMNLVNPEEDIFQKFERAKSLIIWMSGCGYDFTQHNYFIKERDELLK